MTKYEAISIGISATALVVSVLIAITPLIVKHLQTWHNPLGLFVQTLHCFDFDDITKFVFTLIIQNKKDTPVVVSHIDIYFGDKFISDQYNDNPITIGGKCEKCITREYLSKIDNQSYYYNFSYRIGEKTYNTKLFAEVENGSN